MSWFRWCVTASLILFGGTLEAADDSDLASALEKVRSVGAKGQGHREAVAAVKVVSQADLPKLTQILAAMDGSNLYAENWLRGAAEAVAQRAIEDGHKLPVPELEKFLADANHSPRGRRLAFELIASVDPSAESRLIPGLLDDPSLELRRDAVAQLLAQADKEKATDKEAALPKYRKAFDSSRDLDQIKTAAAKLKEYGETADIAGHMGYVMSWRLIGPFDNVEDIGWDTAYQPESSVDLNATMAGQKGSVAWTSHTTADPYGRVDIAKAIGIHKGAVAYAYAELLVDEPQACELRLGSPNANKIWLNGELLSANHVYHAGDKIDQYIGRGKLVAGKNMILVKICQNEQKEEWAQKWGFQLRVCDSIGSPILSNDRPKFTPPPADPSKAAATN